MCACSSGERFAWGMWQFLDRWCYVKWRRGFVMLVIGGCGGLVPGVGGCFGLGLYGPRQALAVELRGGRPRSVGTHSPVD